MLDWLRRTRHHSSQMPGFQLKTELSVSLFQHHGQLFFYGFTGFHGQGAVIRLGCLPVLSAGLIIAE